MNTNASNPAIIKRTKLQTALLACGIMSSLYYAALNIFVPVFYPGYNSASYTVSELSAIDAPTRVLWTWLCILYTLMITAFGWGVWHSLPGNKRLRTAGILLFVYGIFNTYWPPMHQRQVLAAGGSTLTDTLHLTYAGITVCLMMLSMGFGAFAFGRKFRIYTIATMILLLAFGIMTGADAPKVQANLPTPFAGVWERINIGLFMVWVIALAVKLLRGKEQATAA